MLRKTLAVLLFLLLNQVAWAQQATLTGTVKTAEGGALELAAIALKGTSSGTQTNAQGQFQLTVPGAESFTVVIQYVGFKTQELKLKLQPGETRNIVVNMQPDVKMLNKVVVRGRSETDTREEVSIMKLDPRLSSTLPSAFGDFNKMLVALPGVVSNNELSSTYSVRGGNYDENLVYVNGIEIYRPFLVTSGQQEGLSFINPEMAGNVEFSSGGWQPKYGDKLSSVLNIRYKQPTKFAGSVTGGLTGGAAHLEAASKNKKINYLFGARHKDARYLFHSLEVNGDYKPVFSDFQSYVTFNFTKDSVLTPEKPARTTLGILTAFARNRYELSPTSSETSFGTVNRVVRLRVEYEGREQMQYETYQAGLNLTHRFTDWLTSELILSGVRSDEREFRDTEAFYRFCDVNTDPSSPGFNECVRSRDVGSRYDHSRNSLRALIASLENRNIYRLNAQNTLQWGLKVSREQIDDKLSEFNFIDSTDYVVNRSLLKTDIGLQSYRYQAYAQHTIELDSLKTLTYGLRASYWNFNKEFTITPRVQFAFTPAGNPDLSYKLAAGLYYQPPFYRELRNAQGELNKNLKAQRSAHFIAGTEYRFQKWNRAFKLTAEAYYKHLTNVVPYDVENVRLRYYALNNAKAYAAGFDVRVNGEFIKGAESWFSLGVLTTKEDIEGDKRNILDAEGNVTGQEEIGYVRRPNDQRITLGVFFQDHLPNNPTIKMYLNMLFGSGLAFSYPGNPGGRGVLRGRAYVRPDVGFSKLITLRDASAKNSPFESLWISLEILNLVAANNLVGYSFVEDINGVNYAVPNYLSARTVNLRFIARF
ncbi:carboxypeptidase-like regulatory domain-containing protein [Adhaeribacter sp. BT258]|uniref:Carboxypeptidase-like regulatory domain-containing protein n=1 Tax=Adhaeribacter terrigena TaxID=2793070 RepID=A0ABS1C2V2_9BACT|nr:TonB-dependent receptor [Adhaeribacter terrigena]MBK0402890.1 carboxypeptidase-like regulatory domain-containing protein [Adhaeribacter terrigena]